MLFLNLTAPRETSELRRRTETRAKKTRTTSTYLTCFDRVTGAHGNAHVDERDFEERTENVAGATAVADSQQRERTGLHPTETGHLLPSVFAQPVLERYSSTKGTWE